MKTLSIQWFVTVIMMMLFVVPIWADNGNNNTCDNAESVTLDYVSSGASVSKTDKNDYYSFTPTVSGSLMATVTGSDKKLSMYLYNSNCTTEFKKESSINNPSLTYFVTAGVTYKILLQNQTTKNTNYTLSLELPISPTTDSEGGREFSLRKNLKINGDVAVIGNTVLCNPGGATCSETADGVSNADVNLQKSNQSYSTLTLPGASGVNVKWARLYWQGRLKEGNGWTATRKSSAKSISLQTPTASASSVPNALADFIEYSSGENSYSIYSAYADVTEMVKTGGAGQYAISNLYTQEGKSRDNNNDGLGHYGAWTLVVMYEKPGSLQYKDLSVFDGFKRVTGTDTEVDVVVGGFFTPTSGTVNSKVYTFAGEGDTYIEGDVLKMGGILFNTAMVDISTQPNNDFNSRIDVSGARWPNLINNNGIDIHSYNVGTSSGGKNIISNSEIGAKFKFTTSGDHYFPSLIVFSTDLYVPDVCYEEKFTKDGIDVNGQSLNIMDTLDVNVKIKNRGAEIAKGVSIEKFIEQASILDYKSNSMFVRPIGASGFSIQTDSIGDDTADYDATVPKIKFRLGNGADGANGGQIGINQETEFNYSMEIKKYAPSVEENTYYVSYSSEVLSAPITGIRIQECVSFNNSFNIVNPDLFTECGYFPDALATRQECSGSAGGTITFGWGSQLKSNPDSTLSTCTVVQDQWDTTSSCETKDCKELPGNALSVNAHYDNPPTSVASITATTSTTDYTVSGSATLTGSNYDEMVFSYYPDSQNAIITETATSLNINSVTMNQHPVTLKINSTGTVQIGSINGTETDYTILTPNNPEKIYINSLAINGRGNLSLTAKKELYIGSMIVGRDNSNVVLKGAKVRLNSLTTSSSYGGVSTFTIYADELDIGTLELGEGVTLTIYPYTAGGEVFYKGTTINNSSSSSLYLSSGQYFVSSLSLPGTGSPAARMNALDANQVVNIFINGNFTPGNNPAINADDKNGAFGSLPSTTMRLFINGDLSTDGGGTTINALVYTEGNVNLGNPTYVRGAISANQSIQLGVGTVVVYDDSISNEIYASCENTPDEVQGLFDAWEISGSIYDRNVSTKVVNQPFSLTLASLDDTPELSPIDAPIQYRLVPVSLCVNNDILTAGLTAWADLNLSVTPTADKIFTVPSAEKVAKVQFKWWTGSGTPVWSDMSNVENNCSTDTFAIRPKRFDVDSNVSTGTKIKAGQTFQLRFYGLDNSDQNTTNYTDTVGVNFDVNTAEKKAGCITGTFNPSVTTGWSYVNGSHVIDTNYSEVGQVDINVSEESIACSSRFAATDCNDNLISDAILNIESVVKTFDFIPDHFTLNAVLNNGGNGFTYLSNDLNMSADLNVTVTAENAGDQVTQNYNNECYAKKTDYTIMYDAPTITPSGSLTKLIFRESLTNVGGSKYPIGTAFDVTDLNETQLFLSTHKGIAYPDFMINFDRNETKTVSPFILKVTNIDVVDDDGVVGTQTFNTTAYYVYGRIIPRDVRVFGNNSFVANAWYEVFGVPTINSTQLAVSRNSGQWYINNFHDDSNDGDGKVTYVNTTAYNIGIGAVNGIETYNFSGNFSGQTPPYSAKAHINTDPWLWYGVNALGYADPGVNVDGTVDGTINSDDCLHHPCFNINVAPAVGRAGSAASEGLRDEKANKSTSTGTGVTYDYTPATR